MKKVLVVVGIIISAVIISGIIVGLCKNEKTLFNEKIETDNNVLISIKVIESNKGWQPDKTMIISDENEHLIRYAIGFEDYTNYLPSYYFCYDMNIWYGFISKMVMNLFTISIPIHKKNICWIIITLATGRKLFMLLSIKL